MEYIGIKIGAAYVRVSTDGQIEYSPESQIRLIQEYAKRDGYIIPAEYIYQDDGISGKRADKRPAFMLMIATAKQKEHPFDTIFVWKYSRFARNQEESLVYKNLLKRNGVTVKSISEPSADDNPFSGLIESIISWMDEYYVINLANEVRRGMTEKARRGEAMGKPPFGFRVEDKTLVPNEDAETVRWIFEQYAGGKSTRGIAMELGNAGVTLKSDKPPDIYGISYILRNPAYIGKIRWSTEQHGTYRSADYIPNADDESLVDGKHDPIISRELWDAAQERLKGKCTEIKYERKGCPVFMVKGLIRCSDCGSTLTYRKEKKALQCYKYSRGQCHKSHYIPVKKANDAVISYLESVLEDDSFTFPNLAPPKKKITRDWDKLIASEESRLQRARTALLDGAFTSVEYKQIKSEIEETISRLRQGQSEEAQESAPVDTHVLKGKVVGVLELLKSPDVDDSAKNGALRSIIDKIVYDRQKNTFDFYFSL